jgi:hypothetical protein
MGALGATQAQEAVGQGSAQPSALGAVADGVGRVFPERGRRVESGGAAADGGLAGAAMAVAGDKGIALASA